MQEVFEFLKKLEVNYVATVTEEGLPSCRPFGDLVWFDGKIYLLTKAHKAVARQLVGNDHVCIVAYDGREWLRIHCRALDDSENIAAKEAIIQEFDWAEEAGYTIDNPDFKCYYLAEAHAEVRDSDGQVLAEYDF